MLSRFKPNPLIPVTIFYILFLTVTYSGNKLPNPRITDPAYLAINGSGSYGLNVTATGAITNFPEEHSSQGFTTFVLNAVNVNGQQVHGLVQVRIYELGLPFTSGDQVKLLGFLSLPGGKDYFSRSRNPGSFDYPGYMAKQGIFTLMFVKTGNWLYLKPGNLTKRLAADLRHDMLECFSRYLTPENSVVMAGITLGLKPESRSELRENFVRSGTMHLLVASGSNVGLVVIFWLMFGKWILRLKPHWLAWGTLPWVILYTLLTGAEAPVLRASIMAASGVIAYLMKRESWPYQALALSCLVILIFKPSALFEAGFQMSYIATLAIMVAIARFSGLWKAAAKIKMEKPWLQTLFKLLCRVWLMLLVGMAAQISLTPILAYYFQRISPAGLLSNLLAGPLSAICMVCGFVLYIFQLLPVPWLPEFVAVITNSVTSSLLFTVNLFASLPWSSVPIARPGLSGIAGFYMTLGATLWFAPGLRAWQTLKKAWYKLTIAGLGVLLVVAGWFLPAGFILDNSLRITWLDTGRKYVVTIEPPQSRKVIVIAEKPDPGSRKERILFAYLAYRRKEQVEWANTIAPGATVTHGKTSLTRKVSEDKKRRLYKVTYNGFATIIADGAGKSNGFGRLTTGIGGPPVRLNGAITWTTNGRSSRVITYN